MRDFIDNLKREATENNYQIGFDKADDRIGQITEFLKKDCLTFKFSRIFDDESPAFSQLEIQRSEEH
jgi:hypothetical protein